MTILRVTYDHYVFIAQEKKEELKKAKEAIKKINKIISTDKSNLSYYLEKIELLKKLIITYREIISMVHRMIHTKKLSHSEQRRLNELISRRY